MKRIAKFEKVSFEQFKKDWIDSFDSYYSEEEIQKIYNEIKLPKRATKGSAGYDFYAPAKAYIKPNETIKFLTGIRVSMNDGWVLKCYPRSGLGFKYRIQLDNSVGIIDSDYYFSSNEGHIMAKLTNDSKTNKDCIIQQGDGFMQGIFVEYGITIDDNTDGIRDGGFGSTNNN